MKRTTRYQAAIVEHDHILMLKVRDPADGHMFWVIPGGGQEVDETEEACVQREVLEETCLHVDVLDLILDEAGIGDHVYERAKTYVCRITGGELRAGCEPEFDTAHWTTIQEVRWFDLHDPGSWDALAVHDPITYPLLQRVRSALGYPKQAVAST